MEDRAPVVLTPPQLSARLAARQPNGRRPLLMYHRWEALLFLHWTIPPARLQETLPDGLTVDTYGGHGYLGIVPFFMRNVRSVGLPRLPWISAFQELNVRTYVFGRECRAFGFTRSIVISRSLSWRHARSLASPTFLPR